MTEYVMCNAVLERKLDKTCHSGMILAGISGVYAEDSRLTLSGMTAYGSFRSNTI